MAIICIWHQAVLLVAETESFEQHLHATQTVADIELLLDPGHDLLGCVIQRRLQFQLEAVLLGWTQVGLDSSGVGLKWGWRVW